MHFNEGNSEIKRKIYGFYDNQLFSLPISFLRSLKSLNLKVLSSTIETKNKIKSEKNISLEWNDKSQQITNCKITNLLFWHHHDLLKETT